MSVNVAIIGGLIVAFGSDDHTDVTTEHRGRCTDEESEHSVRELVILMRPWHIDSTEDDDSKDGTECGKSSVLFFQESNGSL